MAHAVAAPQQCFGISPLFYHPRNTPVSLAILLQRLQLNCFVDAMNEEEYL